MFVLPHGGAASGWPKASEAVSGQARSQRPGDLTTTANSQSLTCNGASLTAQPQPSTRALAEPSPRAQPWARSPRIAALPQTAARRGLELQVRVPHELLVAQNVLPVLRPPWPGQGHGAGAQPTGSQPGRPEAGSAAEQPAAAPRRTAASPTASATSTPDGAGWRVVGRRRLSAAPRPGADCPNTRRGDGLPPGPHQGEPSLHQGPPVPQPPLIHI